MSSVSKAPICSPRRARPRKSPKRRPRLGRRCRRPKTNPGGGDAVSTSDGEGSPTGTFDRPNGGVGVEGVPLVTAGELRGPRLGCNGRGAPGEDSGLDGTGPNHGASDAFRTTACCGGEASDDYLLARCLPPAPSQGCLPVLAAARVRGLILMKVRPSIPAPVVASRRSWLAVPSLFRDTSCDAPTFTPLPDVVPPSGGGGGRPSPTPDLVPDGQASFPAAPPWDHRALLVSLTN